MFAKPLTLPPMLIAICVAASFPEHNIKPYNKSLYVIISPVFNPSLEPPILAACLHTSTFSSMLVIFSNITIAVIILVVDAMGTSLFSFLPQITILLVLSYITAYFEFIFGSFAPFALVISSSNQT